MRHVQICPYSLVTCPQHYSISLLADSIVLAMPYISLYRCYISFADLLIHYIFILLFLQGLPLVLPPTQRSNMTRQCSSQYECCKTTLDVPK